jgi:hypothetical protein
MSEFHLDGLRPGLILNMSTRSFAGWLIRMVLGKDWEDRRECPNHDAIVVEDRDHKLWIGESVFPVAKIVSIEEYERRVRSGYIYRLRVLEVVGATREQERKAAQWWMENVRNSPYDLMAFPRLCFKALFGNWINSVAGWTWARWCTEGVVESYKNGANLDPCKKLNPTPLTMWMRMKQGVLKMLFYEGELK